MEKADKQVIAKMLGALYYKDKMYVLREANGCIGCTFFKQRDFAPICTQPSRTTLAAQGQESCHSKHSWKKLPWPTTTEK